MKLLRLKLNVDFRSLSSGFEVHFLREQDFGSCFEFQPYCLAGRNGSGKSNVLEALAAIFYHIECIYLDYRPDGFEYESKKNKTGFKTEKSTPNAFELEYLISNDSIVPTNKAPILAHILITKKSNQRPKIHWLNRADHEKVDQTELSRTEVKISFRSISLVIPPATTRF